MVKGVARRIVVVKSPDKKIFEEAIFIVRDDIVGRNGVSAWDVVREARKIAASYSSKGDSLPKRLMRLPGLICAALGAAATGLVWLLVTLL